MLLYFNQDNLNLNVQCGALEDYQATPEVKEIVRRAQELKEKRDEFTKTVFDPEIKQLLEMVDRINITANPELKSLRSKGNSKK